MIKNLMRGPAVLVLALIPLIAAPAASAATAAPAVPAAAEVLMLSEALGQLPVVEESREGYERSKFKHWNAGLDPRDGCNTRNEVLLAEAVEMPEVGPGCKLTGGLWLSYYDEQMVDDPSKIDIDHMVPLAEAWDSGASAWTAQRREAYANDQGASTSLVAVTARSNRQKADKDPAQWTPAPAATCRYLAEWVGTKLRWGLSADQVEADAVGVYAAGPCENTVVHYTPAP
ncbi:HNH endonuclease family protein [Streptomyces virginiae]|uniref:HNH endonuclease family protein n=1 Tax=Streptomyces virginiae TaxID=1961 RepID=UPI003802CE79